MEKIKFTKMQGTGNDFIMVNGFKNRIKKPFELCRKLCDRHFGIGGDGLIYVLPPENKNNDFKMRIFNSDGSEPEMCGNGIRCFAHFLYEQNIIKKTKIRVETLAGLITPDIIKNEDNYSQVRVNMGKPKFKPEDIPIIVEDERNYIKNYTISVAGRNFDISCVSMGNPHTIIFVENMEKYDIEKWGSLIEKNKKFPEKTNVEFIEILNKSELNMKVWERGAGITLACGTGASAAVVAGIKNELLNNNVLVHLPGGDLEIEWNGEDVFMTGPATTVFTGEIFI